MLQARGPKSVVNQNGLRVGCAAIFSCNWLTIQIIDVNFNNKTSSTSSNKDDSNHIIQPSSNSEPQANGPSLSTSSDDENTRNCSPNDASNGDANENGTLCMIPEEPSWPCTKPEMKCGSSSLPECQRFPMEQADPADVVEESNNSAAIIETVIDGDNAMADHARSNSGGSASMPSLPWSTALSASSLTSGSSRASEYDHIKHDPIADGLTNLESLDYLMHDRSHQSLQAPTSGGIDALGALNKSKIKLHLQMQDLVHKFSLAHQTSPDADAEDSTTAIRHLRLNGENKFKGIRLVHKPLVARPLGCTKIPKRRQLELWRNFSDNVAPCLDACSNKPHFQHSLPMLAKSADHLHYAALAFSSRHLENQEPNSSFSESRGLQKDAINLLLPELHTLDTATIATCVLLCIIDLLSAPTSKSSTSLRTCAALMETADINARSGGFRQAVFWCFANFAIWHGLSYPAQPTVLPMRFFYPSDSLVSAVDYVRSHTLGDGHAKYAVFVASMINNTLARSTASSGLKQAHSQAQAQHSVLTDLLSDWFNCRPEDMQPLMSYPSILDDEHHPFPMVLYPTIPAAIGNLLHHCASTLVLQNEHGSSDGKRKTSTNNDRVEVDEASKNQDSSDNVSCSPPETTIGKRMTWHVRQICGILSESNEPAVLIHGQHALNIAAKVIDHSSEKEAILMLWERIEKSTGWKTRR